MALSLADDIVVINTFDGGDRLFSRRLACVDCGISMPEMTPRAFSFNSPHGACPDCQGLGAIYDFDPRPRRAGRVAVAAGRRDRAVGQGRSEAGREALTTLAGRSASIRRAVRRAAEEASAICCSFGAAGAAAADAKAHRNARAPEPKEADPFGADFEGLIPNLRRRYEEGPGPNRKSSSRIARCGRARLQRRAAQAAEPRRPRQGPDDCRLRRPADLRGAARVRRARAHAIARR